MELENISPPPAPSGNHNVKTLAGDMARVIENNEAGMIKSIIHEQEQRQAISKNISPRSRRNILFLLFSGIFIGLAIGVLMFLGVFKKKTTTVDVAPQAASIIFVDQNSFIDVTDLVKDTIAQSVFNQVNRTEVKEGGVEAIYLTEKKEVIGFAEFAKITKSNIDVSDTSLISDNFLLGVANQQTKNLFILLNVRSFNDIFSVMHAWESKMFSDLHGFFGVALSAETGHLLNKDFEDIVVANKNARALKDADGKIVMMYVFIDDHSVIITDSEVATAEVIARLEASQVKK